MDETNARPGADPGADDRRPVEDLHDVVARRATMAQEGERVGLRVGEVQGKIVHQVKPDQSVPPPAPLGRPRVRPLSAKRHRC